MCRCASVVGGVTMSCCLHLHSLLDSPVYFTCTCSHPSASVSVAPPVTLTVPVRYTDRLGDRTPDAHAVWSLAIRSAALCVAMFKVCCQCHLLISEFEMTNVCCLSLKVARFLLVN
ncbi:hypothetical protein NP493_280g00015 [Ridgeia piscesae]|uniref:Uncharacterized protein n=1 Tax=Ridgeia piscesae TaxID=27915 RepID=A0AAD9NX81_RIDPI|nr:hypothetical protein NP493_280g00015 [Ridgeia piscesae]